MLLRHPRHRIALILLLAGAAASSAAAQERPRILLVNDDGIAAEGLAAMAAELRTFAEVVVVAPAEDQSGASHSTVIRTSITEIRPYHRDGTLFGYGVAGRPADATIAGILLHGVDRPFDLVVSGINAGANTGMIAHYSGTVGAASEGVLRGVPAIATSQDARQDYALSARITGDVVRRVLRDGLPEGTLLSINIPAGELKGIRMAPMGGTYFGTGGLQIVEQSPERTTYRATTRGAVAGGAHTDTAAYLDGYVTITPIRIDRTDYEFLGRMGAWEMAPLP
jgi:5'-nucleotidase